jgi:hypothetical protein
MSVRAKFRCQSIKEMPGGEGTMKEVVLNPVYGNGEENKQWSKWTPSGELKMTITNPSAYDQFKVNGEYYLDITPVEK